MSTPRTVLTAAVPPLAMALCALALAGCGTRQAPAAAGPSSAATASSPGATSTGSATASSVCQSSALKVSLRTTAAGVAAGSSLVPLEIENVSASSCTLPEYPDVSFASGSAGPDIGAPASRQHASRASALVLAPGTVAHAWLQIADVANYPASSCKPVTAHGLRVRFGSAAPATYIARAVQACAGAQHGSNSVLAVFPVQAGPARRGTAP